MRTVAFASLRGDLRRYVAVALAVLIGVAFIVTTGAISGAARDGFTRGVALPYEGADAVVSGLDARDVGRLRAAAEAEGATTATIGWAYVPVRPASGSTLPTATVAELPGDPDLRWPDLADGDWAVRPGEAVVDARAAAAQDVEIGDRLRLGVGDDAREVTVVGTVEQQAVLAAADVYVPWADLAAVRGDLVVDSVAWRGPGSFADQRAAIAAAVPDARVTTPDAYVDEAAAEANGGVDVMATMLLLFAAIALFVAALVIANTFSILLARRRRELALLRCVGATRRQLVRAVRLECAVVGTAATALGLLAGVGLGHAVVALVAARFPQAGLGAATVGIGWLLGAAAVGIGVTLAAAWLPTRRAVRVAPVAALGPDDDTRLHTGTGRIRLAAGLGLVAIGGLGLAAAAATEQAVALLAGGAAAFAGVVLLGPVLVPALVRGVGGLLGRLPVGGFGPAAQLATDNAVRDPRRTAAATASLLVGVTLTTAVLTGMASARTAVDDEMARQHPVDLAVTGSAVLPDDALTRAEGLEGVTAAVAVPGAAGRVGDVDGMLLAPDVLPEGALDDVVRAGTVTDVAPGVVRVPYEWLGQLPESGRVTVTAAGGGSLELEARGGEGWGEAALVAPSTLRQLTGEETPRAPAAVWLRAAPDVDPGDVGPRVEQLATSLDAGLTSGLERREYVTLQLDVLTASVVGLLGIAVVIALLGIANTLGLSVLERARENALLRALGLTRGQLRATLAVEGALLAGVATLLGTAVGVVFAWVGVLALVRPAIAAAPLALPVGQLAAVAAVAAAAGLLAAVLPARRAARISPAEGLVTG